MVTSVGVVLAGVVSLALQINEPASTAAESLAMVREIPVDTLKDVAVAVYDARHPVIYYNPEVLRRIGPALSAFFLAHERGHIFYRHTRSNALASGGAKQDSVLQSRELEADCYATALLADRNRAAVDGAVRFFSRLGPIRFDAVHPTGAQRAAKILACLPVAPKAAGPAPLPPSAPWGEAVKGKSEAGRRSGFGSPTT